MENLLYLLAGRLGTTIRPVWVIPVAVGLMIGFMSGCDETPQIIEPIATSSPTALPIVPFKPLPTPLTAEPSLLENNNLIARVEGTLARPGNVYLEYWGEDGVRFRSKPVPSRETSYLVHAVRLRPNSMYSYQVFGTDVKGRISEGPKGVFVTGDLPSILRDARFNVLEGQPTYELTYLEFRQRGFFGLVAIDGEGHIVWYYTAPAGEEPYVMDQRDNGNIVYLAGGIKVVAHGLVEINPLGEELARSVDLCPPTGPMHHEVQILPDQRVMYLSRYILRPGHGEPPSPQEGDTIGIWDPKTGENSIVWNIFDFISPRDRIVPDSNSTLPEQFMWGGCSQDLAVQDWSHGNSARMADDGMVLVSFRHLDQVVSIAPDFRSIRWRLGGPGSDFTFPDPRDKFYHQHTASQIPNGNILLFDNGNGRPKTEGGEYSRGLELELDFGNMTARKVWEFRYNPDIFADCCSIVHRLDNGNSLLVFGLNAVNVCCRPFTIIEVNPSGNVVWEVQHLSAGKFSQYRVYPSDSVMGEVRVSDN